MDGSLDWLKNVMRVSPAHYRFHWADIGPIAAWSHPKDKTTAPKWPFYSIGALAAEEKPFDFYFVDGRFRVASVCACLMHAALHGKTPGEFRVGLHDFRARHTKTYKDVLTVAEVVEGFDPNGPAHQEVNLVILRRRADVGDAQVLQLWDKHSMVPD